MDHPVVRAERQLDGRAVERRGRPGQVVVAPAAALRLEPLAEVAQNDAVEQQVVRAEVVAPLRDAVGLVHHQQRDADLPHPLHELLVLEALHRDVEQLRLSLLDALELLLGLPLGERAVHQAGLQAVCLDRLDLVLDQCDQRRDDQRRAGQELGGQLEDQ